LLDAIRWLLRLRLFGFLALMVPDRGACRCPGDRMPTADFMPGDRTYGRTFRGAGWFGVIGRMGSDGTAEKHGRQYDFTH
jgi:hypothetical protein